MNLNQVSRQTVDSKITPLLPYVDKWEVKAGGLLIGEGKGSEGELFESVLDKIEDTFQGQMISIRIGKTDNRGRFNSQTQKFQFIINNSVEDDGNGGINLMLPAGTPANEGFFLSGIPGMTGNNRITLDQLDGLVNARAKKIEESLSASFTKKQSELEAAFEKRLAQLEKERIINEAEAYRKRVEWELERRQKELEDERRKFQEEKAKFEDRQKEDLRTFKGVLKGLGSVALDASKEFLKKKGENQDTPEQTGKEKNIENIPDVEEPVFKKVEESPEDTGKIEGGEKEEHKTKLALIQDRAKEICQAEPDIIWQDALKLASAEINDELNN